MIKNIKNNRASIMLVVMIISTSLFTLFLTIAFMANQYKNQVSSLEYWNLAENAVESSLEEGVIEYFEKSEQAHEKMKQAPVNEEKRRRETVLYSAIKNNKLIKTTFWWYGGDTVNIEDTITLRHDSIIDSLIWEIWKITINATRLKDEIVVNIDPFEPYEFRLTAEEREINWTWTQDQIKQLNITWNKTDWNPIDAWLEVIQISWPTNNKWKVETHILHFNHWWTISFWDISEAEEKEKVELRLPTNLEYTSNAWGKEYIFIFKAKANSIVLKIKWKKGDLSSIKIPDRFVEFESEAEISDLWWDSQWKIYFKKRELKKEIYTDFDSNFDYSRNFINF